MRLCDNWRWRPQHHHYTHLRNTLSPPDNPYKATRTLYQQMGCGQRRVRGPQQTARARIIVDLGRHPTGAQAVQRKTPSGEEAWRNLGMQAAAVIPVTCASRAIYSYGEHYTILHTITVTNATTTPHCTLTAPTPCGMADGTWHSMTSR